MGRNTRYTPASSRYTGGVLLQQLAAAPLARQRLPAAPPQASPARLRQLAQDKRKEADALARHLRCVENTATRATRQRIAALRVEAEALENEAAAQEGGAPC